MTYYLGTTTRGALHRSRRYSFCFSLACFKYLDCKSLTTIFANEPYCNHMSLLILGCQ